MGLHEFSWPQHMGRPQEMEPSPSSAHRCVQGEISAGEGPCRSQACHKKGVVCSWVNLGQYHHSSAPANTSRAGKVETMENAAKSICQQARVVSAQLFPLLQEISVYPSMISCGQQRWRACAVTREGPATSKREHPATNFTLGQLSAHPHHLPPFTLPMLMCIQTIHQNNQKANCHWITSPQSWTSCSQSIAFFVV